MENNENKPDYSKAVEEELNSAPPTPTSPDINPPIKSPSKKNTILLPILIVVAIFLVAGVIAIIAVSSTSSPELAATETDNEDKTHNHNDDNDNDENEPTPTFTFKMPELETEIELPEIFKDKVFSYTDGESYFIWGYTGDEKPEYVDQDSPNFFPLFALNYSPEAFSTDKYSFATGDGAHGREDDGRTIYLHAITEIKDIDAEKTDIPDTLINDYEQFVLYFRDGFKYHDL